VLQAVWARELAETLLAGSLPRRWAHTQGVAATARRLAPIVTDNADLLEAAAWLHDIGYAPDLAHAGFHPLDGARYLRASADADTVLCGLVAYHSGAIHEARERGLDADLEREFTPPPQLLGDALTYCDVTTGPDGNRVDVQERLTDIQERYGRDHPVSRAVRAASPSWFESVRRIEGLLSMRDR
jgi:predicted hydrolase (HD superfamily)